ncbi:MAG: class I SAM-dependent DNA methyltransferase [Promethearchaeota archaeon]
MTVSKNLRSRSINSKSLGQYMTPQLVAKFMASLISKPKTAKVLEPCAGEGIFLKTLDEKGFENITAYEVDEQLAKSSERIIHGDFLEIPPKPTFDVVIGNPPYVRWKNIVPEWRSLFKRSEYWNRVMNGLCDLTYAFIYHSVNLLGQRGELIFICPLFWTETLHAGRLREHLSKNGSLEALINLNEAKVFDEGSSTIIIFKYIKGVRLSDVKIVEYASKEPVTLEVTNKVSHLLRRLQLESGTPNIYLENDVFRAYLNEQFVGSEPWHPIPPTARVVRQVDAIREIVQLGNISEIGNGMVSGLDKAFRLEEDPEVLNKRERGSLIYVYKAKTLERFFPSSAPIPYIFTNRIGSEKELRQFYPYFYEKLSNYREILEKRYDYKKDIPWWHWVFLRNKHLFEEHSTKIFVPSKERYDTRGYFRFTLIYDKEGKTHYATQDVTTICLKENAIEERVEYILGMLNSKPIQKWIMTKGFSRGGVHDFCEGPLSIIPIPKVNWENPKEVEFHRLIVEVVEEIVAQRQLNMTGELDEYVMEFIKLKRKTHRLDSFI